MRNTGIVLNCSILDSTSIGPIESRRRSVLYDPASAAPTKISMMPASRGAKRPRIRVPAVVPSWDPPPAHASENTPAKMVVATGEIPDAPAATPVATLLQLRATPKRTAFRVEMVFRGSTTLLGETSSAMLVQFALCTPITGVAPRNAR